MRTQKIISSTFIFIFLFSSFFYCVRAQDRIISKNELPKTAQNFIDKYFSNQTINYIKMDKDTFSVDYEVKFTNRVEIQFDSKGNWEEVDGKHQAIPTGFIDAKIVSYVEKNFPGSFIYEIDKGHFKQEVKISNGLELVFNSSGDFIKIDD